MKRKYELLKDDTIEMCGCTLYRIRALKKFGYVNKGDLGGYIEKKDNLSQEGTCWVYDNARVYGSAKVYGNAVVCDNADVYGYANVRGCIELRNSARISNDAIIECAFDYCAIHGFGSEGRYTTFFSCKDRSIKVNCGCFNGTLDEFVAKVKETHKGNRYEEEYLMAANLAKLRLSNNKERK